MNQELVAAEKLEFTSVFIARKLVEANKLFYEIESKYLHIQSFGSIDRELCR